jgi:hypothetical protein
LAYITPAVDLIHNTKSRSKHQKLSNEAQDLTIWNPTSWVYKETIFKHEGPNNNFSSTCVADNPIGEIFSTNRGPRSYSEYFMMKKFRAY